MMRRLLYGHGLVLALLASNAAAADEAPPVALGRPTAIAEPRAVVLGQPAPLAVQPAASTPGVTIFDPQLRPAALYSYGNGFPVGRDSPTVAPPLVINGPVPPFPPGPVPPFPPGPGPVVAPYFDCAPVPSPEWDSDCGCCPFDGSCACCDNAAPRLYASAEYLMWWTKSSPVSIPLVTGAGLGATTSGAIGEPGTVVLIGDQSYGTGLDSGARFTVGYWLDDCQTWAVEGSYFILGTQSVQRGVGAVGSATSPTVGIPFNDPTLPGESFKAIADPNQDAGFATLGISERLQGADLDLVYNLWQCGCPCDCRRYRVDLLGGFRFLELDENLGFSEATVGLPGSFTPGSTIGITDQFNTQNRFYGGQLGVRASGESGPWFASATAKLAMGDMHESVGIGGLTATGMLGLPPDLAQGGFFASSTNSGRFHRDEFAVVPEVFLQLGYQVSPQLRLFIGYDFLYISNVLRPGDQLDHTINPTQLPFLFGSGSTLSGAARPAFAFNGSDFWAQGISVGLEFRW